MVSRLPGLQRLERVDSLPNSDEIPQNQDADFANRADCLREGESRRREARDKQLGLIRADQNRDVSGIARASASTTESSAKFA